MSTPELQIRISAELTEIKGALAQLQRDLGRTANVAESTAAKAGIGMDRFKEATTRATTALKGMIATFGGFLLIRQLVQSADKMALLDAKVKLVSASTDDAARAQEELFQIAQRTRSGLEETANLYVRIAQSVKGSGLGQQEILGLTETINQAVQLSGATAESANAALIQLGQGLASGTLRGEELNSVLEQTPRLADAIAAGMGIARGELRKLGQEGKLTAQEVIKGLQSQKEAIAKEFAVLPLTVGGAVTKIKNSFLKLVGDVDRAVAGSQGLAGIFSDFADYLSSPRVIDGIVTFVTTFSEGMRSVVETVQEAFAIIDEAIGGIGDRSDTLVGFLVRAFAELPINLKTFVQLAVVEVAAVVDKLIANARLAKNAIKAIFTETTITAAVEGAKAEIAAIEQARDESIAAILAERQRVIGAGDAARKAAQDRRKLAGTAAAAGGGGTTPKGKAGPQIDELAIVKDATTRAIAEVERLYKAAEIGLGEYLDKRTALTLNAIDAEIAAERKKAGAGGEGASQAITNIQLLENAKTDVLRQAENDRTTILKEYAERRRELTIANLEASGQKAEAKRLELQAKWEQTLLEMKANGDQAGVELVENLIRTEVVAAQLDELKTLFDEGLAELRAKEQSIANQVEAGAISALSGERNLQQIREKSIVQLRQYLAAMEALAKATGDKEALKTIEEYKVKLQEAAVVTDDFFSRVEDYAVDAVVNGFMSLIDGSKSVSEAFRDMARQFALAVAQMIIQAYALTAVKAIMGGFGGGGAPVAHSGGVVTRSWAGEKRNVNPIVFAGAPRFHSGGVAGVKRGEVPAILQEGEEVLTKNDPRHRDNGGMSGGQPQGGGVRIINVLDPSLVQDAMGSAAGERAIMNVIQRNAGGISRLLK